MRTTGARLFQLPVALFLLLQVMHHNTHWPQRVHAVNEPAAGSNWHLFVLKGFMLLVR